MSYTSLTISDAENGIVEIRLTRPEQRNAFDDVLIAEMSEVFDRLGSDPNCSVLWLRGEGSCFSAGADLGWMRRMAGYDREANVEDALRLASMLRKLDEFPKPTLALVNGPAIGGGVGLVAACDIVVAAEQAFFQLSEVRLGIVPAVISPYVVRAIGERQARRYCLTAERIDVARAQQIGLIHEAVPLEELAAKAHSISSELRLGGSQAVSAAKRAIRTLRSVNADETDIYTAELIADLRASEEGREGIQAFLDKRQPSWRRDV